MLNGNGSPRRSEMPGKHPSLKPTRIQQRSYSSVIIHVIQKWRPRWKKWNQKGNNKNSSSFCTLVYSFSDLVLYYLLGFLEFPSISKKKESEAAEFKCIHSFTRSFSKQVKGREMQAFTEYLYMAGPTLRGSPEFYYNYTTIMWTKIQLTERHQCASYYTKYWMSMYQHNKSYDKHHCKSL